jgi:hypothetical protein
MLNAVQNRMVEEALVEKEVYEAMLKMRASIGELLGTSASGSSGSGTKVRGQNPVPEFDDLPVGTPPPWHPAAQKMQTADGRAVAIPPPLPEPAQMQPRTAPSPSASQLPRDTMVPAEVLAVGDPMRDPQRQITPFTPPTAEKNGGDPFPQLGPKGRPLG